MFYYTNFHILANLFYWHIRNFNINSLMFIIYLIQLALIYLLYSYIHMYLYLIQKNPFGGFQFYRMYKYISERAVKSVMYNTYTIGNVSAKSSCVCVCVQCVCKGFKRSLKFFLCATKNLSVSRCMHSCTLAKKKEDRMPCCCNVGSADSAFLL